MSVLPITLYGDKILKKKAKPINKVDNTVIRLIQNMFDTMDNADGIGLAANQVGSDKAVFILDLSHIKDFEKTKPLVIINPKIVNRSEELSVMEEGCLSIPQVRADVERPSSIKIVFQDIQLKEHEMETDGLMARVMQHEFDHLCGIYFVDRLSEMKQKELKEILKKIKNRALKFEYPITEKDLSQ